jgi:hypothetical protein
MQFRIKKSAIWEYALNAINGNLLHGPVLNAFSALGAIPSGHCDKYCDADKNKPEDHPEFATWTP